MTNGEIKQALDAITELCGSSNRLPVLDSIKATRMFTAFAAAWAPSEAERVKLVEEYGTKNADGTLGVQGDDFAAFVKKYNTVLGGECDTPEFKPIPLASIEQGYSKNPETGKRDVLDISPASLMGLLSFGLITDNGSE